MSPGNNAGERTFQTAVDLLEYRGNAFIEGNRRIIAEDLEEYIYSVFGHGWIAGGGVDVDCAVAIPVSMLRMLVPYDQWKEVASHDANKASFKLPLPDGSVYAVSFLRENGAYKAVYGRVGRSSISAPRKCCLAQQRTSSDNEDVDRVATGSREKRYLIHWPAIVNFVVDVLIARRGSSTNEDMGIRGGYIMPRKK